MSQPPADLQLSTEGFRAGCPKRCHSGVQIVQSWKQVRPKRLRKNPWTSPDWLKEFKMEGVFQGVITADNCSKEMATHSFMLAWKIPWTEEPGRLQSMRSWRVGNNWATSLSLFTFMHWRRKWQPTPVFLPGESQGQRSLVGWHLWGRTELDTTEAATGAVDKEESSKAPTVKAFSGSQCLLVTKQTLVYQTLTFFIFLWISLFLFEVPSP